MKNEIVKVHDVDIECPFHEEQHWVAVRSICQVLGIDHQKQFERIKTDEILGQLYTDTVYSWGQDNRQRKMFCLPLKYIFGWLFSIDDTKVNEKAKPAFLDYKKLCYEALYEKFVKPETQRGKVLFEKARLQKEYAELEEKLNSENPEFQKLMELKAAIMRTGKEIKEIDNDYVNIQLSLFE